MQYYANYQSGTILKVCVDYKIDTLSQSFDCEIMIKHHCDLEDNLTAKAIVVLSTSENRGDLVDVFALQNGLFSTNDQTLTSTSLDGRVATAVALRDALITIGVKNFKEELTNTVNSGDSTKFESFVFNKFLLKIFKNLVEVSSEQA